MTSKLKCPFCNSELAGTISCPYCRNEKCEMCDEPLPRELLDLLASTRKALKIATKALEEIDTTRCIPQQTLISLGKFSKTTRFNAGNIICVTTPDYIHNTLEQIKHKE